MANTELRDGDKYGFNWGPMSVTRMAYIPGRGYSLSVRTDHAEMQVYVSDKGRVIEPYPIDRRTPEGK